MQKCIQGGAQNIVIEVATQGRQSVNRRWNVGAVADDGGGGGGGGEQRVVLRMDAIESESAFLSMLPAVLSWVRILSRSRMKIAKGCG